MFTNNRHYCCQVIFAAVLIPAIVHVFSVPSRGENLPDQVVRALKNNTAAVDHLTVSWEQTRSSHFALDDLLRLIEAPDDKAFLQPRYNTVIYQDEKMWCNSKYTQWVSRGFYKCNSDYALDGKLLYVSDSTKDTPTVIIRDLDHLATHEQDHYVYYCDYLEAAGFKVHNRNGTIHLSPESDLLYLVDQGARISSLRDTTVNSAPCLAVDVTIPGGQDVFYLDPAREYAMHRRERYNTTGKLVQVTANSEFAELLSPRVWLPKQCRVSDYTGPTTPDKIFGEPIVVTNIVVKELNQKRWPPERFVIDLSRPGTFVLDSRKEAEKMVGAFRTDDGLCSYRIDPTPEDLSRAVALAGSRWKMLVIGINFIVIVLLTGLIVARYYRHRHQVR